MCESEGGERESEGETKTESEDVCTMVVIYMYIGGICCGCIWSVGPALVE